MEFGICDKYMGPLAEEQVSAFVPAAAVQARGGLPRDVAPAASGGPSSREHFSAKQPCETAKAKRSNGFVFVVASDIQTISR